MRKACEDTLKPEDSTNMSSEEYMEALRRQLDLTNSKQTNILKLELDIPKTRDKPLGSLKEELAEAAKTAQNQPKFGNKVGDLTVVENEDSKTKEFWEDRCGHENKCWAEV